MGAGAHVTERTEPLGWLELPAGAPTLSALSRLSRFRIFCSRSAWYACSLVVASSRSRRYRCGPSCPSRQHAAAVPVEPGARVHGVTRPVVVRDAAAPRPVVVGALQPCRCGAHAASFLFGEWRRVHVKPPDRRHAAFDRFLPGTTRCISAPHSLRRWCTRHTGASATPLTAVARIYRAGPAFTSSPGWTRTRLQTGICFRPGQHRDSTTRAREARELRDRARPGPPIAIPAGRKTTGLHDVRPRRQHARCEQQPGRPRGAS